MANDYRGIPTLELVRMWESAIEAIRGRNPSELTASDYDSVYEMRRELDRRSGDGKPTVYVDFESGYVTD